MLLEVGHVTKQYRRGPCANRDISLTVGEGEVFGLLGPNGAGKTTLVRQILGLLAPTSGAITIDGADVVADPAFARRACSYQPQSQVPIAGLTPVEAVELVARVRGASARRARTRARELVEALELGEWVRRGGQSLSGGVVRLVAFCMAVAVPGRVVILDEPTNDVDPLRRRLLWRFVREVADAGSAVLLVTHNVLEAERSVDRLAIVNDGSIVVSGTPASLREEASGLLRLEMVLEPGASAPRTPRYLASPVVVGRRLIAEIPEDRVGRAVSWARGLRADGTAEEFSIGPSTLEDVYVRVVGSPGTNGQGDAVPAP